MKRNQIITFTLALLGVFSFMTSCKSGKSAISSETTPSSGVLTNRAAIGEFRQVIDGYGKWSYLKIPLTVRLKQPKSISINGTAYMENGKKMAIVLRFFGMEVGSLDIESDSITIIDKINKAYFKESVDDLLAGFPATESNLQSLLLGRVFMPGADGVEVSDFEIKACDAPGLWTAGGIVESHDLDYSFAFRSPGMLKALSVTTGNGSPVTIAYGEEVTTDQGSFAAYTSVVADKMKTPVEVALEWNFGKAVWNSPETVVSRSKVPSGYSRISPAAVVKMLGSF